MKEVKPQEEDGIVKLKIINMINWINSWNSGNKKEVYELSFRLGKLTVFELGFCPCWICENKKASCTRFRFMILNFGFEI